MTVIFQTNEACNVFHAVLANERRLQSEMQEELISSLMLYNVGQSDRKDRINQLHKQLETMRMLESISVHHVFGWQQRNNDKHRVVLVSFCPNDIHGDDSVGKYAKEFFWQEYYVPMATFTRRSGEVVTYHAADSIPLSGERGVCGGFINHGSVTEPRWSCHT
jgi:hypothetical protein